MLSEQLRVPWRTFVVTNEMLQSGKVYLWFASPEPCYVNEDCIYYEQHQLLSITTPMPGFRSFNVDALTFDQLQRTFIQVGEYGLAPAAECLQQGFVGWLNPARNGIVSCSRNRSPFY